MMPLNNLPKETLSYHNFQNVDDRQKGVRDRTKKRRKKRERESLRSFGVKQLYVPSSAPSYDELNHNYPQFPIQISVITFFFFFYSRNFFSIYCDLEDTLYQFAILRFIWNGWC